MPDQALHSRPAAFLRPATFPVTFGLLLLTYAVLEYVLIPSHRPLPFPIHPDDFRNLSESLATIIPWPARPVSMVLIALLSSAGAPAFYGALFLMTLLCPALVLTFLSRFFERPATPTEVVLFGAAVFALPGSIESPLYTGLITNLSSSVFGWAAMLCLLLGLRDPRARAWTTSGVWLYALSAFSKEDFLLPPLLLVAGLAWETRRVRRGLQVLCTLLFVDLCVAAYNHRVGSAFTSLDASGPYAKVLSPNSVLRVLGRYIALSPFLSVLTAATLLLAALALWELPALRPRILFGLLVVLFLIAPYTALPNHVFSYYAYGWVPWEVGLILVAGKELAARRPSLRRPLLACGAAAAILAVASTQAERRAIVLFYRTAQDQCRRMIETLTRNRGALAAEPRIGVLGLETFSPWSLSWGEYLTRRVGLHKKWIVFVESGSIFYPLDSERQPQEVERPVVVRPLAEAAEYPEMLFLRFDAAGHGTLQRGSAAVPHERAIFGLYPPSTTAGAAFQVQADGSSALAVRGWGFEAGDRILWNGVPLPTVHGGPELLTATVPPELFREPGDIAVSVAGARAVFHVLPAHR